MRVLITGATGFIGGRIAARLCQLDAFAVVAVGRGELPPSLLFDAGRVEYLKGSMSDGDFLDRAMRGVDAVIHCAGYAGSWGPYADYYAANVKLTEDLLAAARRSGVKRFVNISSSSVYFAYRDLQNVREDEVPQKFVNAYGQTKFEAEQKVQQAHSTNFMTVSLRPRFVIGAGDANILPRLIRLQKAGGLFQVGGGKNLVSVTSIENLIDAVLLCLRAAPEALGTAYNIANPEPVIFWDLVDDVLSQLGIRTPRRKLPRAPLLWAARLNAAVSAWIGRRSEPVFLPLSIGVISQDMTVNIERAKERLGYVARHSTEDAIQDFTSWWKLK